MKRVRVLGAGRVSRPIVRYFLDQGGYQVAAASLFIADARALVEDHPDGTALAVDVTDSALLDPLIRDSDLVVSLVPYDYHVAVARLAIRHRVSMVTASYVSPQMRELDDAARDAGVTILNEVGLDPGIDHMSAVRMIAGVKQSGASVQEFVSCCGGLPAPEAADNPWRYKFSWSPRGALLASTLDAAWLEDGEVKRVPGLELFSCSRPYDVEGVGRFEMYPNRDSLTYIDLYGLAQARTVLRGTLRYPGWSETTKALADLGLLDVVERRWADATSYADLLSACLPPGGGALKRRLAERLGLPESHEVIERMDWAGLLSADRLPSDRSSPLDLLAARFAERMGYADGERDMVLLRHEIIACAPDRPSERRISLLVAYGEPGGDSATSRTVSLPAAIAGRLLLDGLSLPGVQVPTEPELADAILDELAGLGIRFKEWTA